jgi:septation ring formation regulator EzrA
MLSDHQDSEHFSYERNWDEIEDMLRRAERKLNDWVMRYHQAVNVNDRQVMKDAARNKKALEGVIKTLRWVLGDINVDHPLE